MAANIRIYANLAEVLTMSIGASFSSSSGSEDSDEYQTPQS